MRSAYADRTIRALELVAARPVTAADAAAALALDVRTARRLLERLALEGVVVRRRGRGARYAPGPRLLALATEVLLGGAGSSGPTPALPAPARAPG